VDPNLHREIASFGGHDVDLCMNCGNCTAVCPLSEDQGASFPRRIIHLLQVGRADKLSRTVDLWLCYYCGECSDTCPRHAEPGELMASARRYVIASLDPTGISRFLYTSKLFTGLLLAGLSLLLALILLLQGGEMKIDHPTLFEFIPLQIVHDMGLVVIFVALFAMVFGVLRLVRLLSRTGTHLATPPTDQRANPLRRLVAAIGKVAAEMAAEKRHRSCTEESRLPWYRSRWFMHGAIMWGFLGLAAATAFDYVLLLLAGKVPGQPEALWHPTRLLGTLAGLLVVFGTTRALVSRIKKPDKYSSHSLLSDWLFLWLLLVGTVTGFLVEVALYLPRGMVWGYVVFLAHVILGMEIVLLFPFTKFAHAVYRPVALLVQELAPVRSPSHDHSVVA
jgi:nitrate reductase gamma subunit/NAD-dependent dihydropyrimidine dehydrogenase PreA subunit